MYPALIIIVAILNSFLALFILSKNYKNHINISFSLFIISLVLWIITNFLSNSTQDYYLTFTLNKLVFASASLIAYSLLYFSLVFPRSQYNITKKHLFLLVLPVLFTNLLIFSNTVITSITFLSQGGTGVRFGSGVFYFVAQFLFYVVFSIIILSIKLKKSRGYERTQIQYLLFGIAISIFLGILTNLIIPLILNNFIISNIGPFFTLIIVGTTTYAIVRHRLLDIHLVVARTVAYSLLLLILGIFYSVSIFLISKFLFTNSVNNSQVFISALLALFIAVTAQPLKKLLERTTDKIFFKNQYNTSDLLSSLTSIMATTIQLEHVSQETLHILLETMQINWGALYIFKGHNVYKAITKNPRNHFPSPSEVISLAHVKHLMIFEEEKNTIIKEHMRKLDAAVALPLSIGDTLHGLLLLGDKKSGGMYSEQDIKVLSIFGPEISVALENATAYEEIRQFNIKLHDEIGKATKDLKDANTHLQQLDRLKDEFVSLASHELRTPMTVIKNYLWMLLYDKKSKLSASQREYTERAYSSVDRLIALVNDMLNISRIESGRLTVTLTPVDVKELIHDTVTEIQSQAASQGIKLYMKAPNKKIRPVTLDSSRIKEVLINLIGNALKFTPKGGEIKVSLVPEDAEVTIQVADTGKGIKVEDLPVLFKKFSIISSDYLRKLNSQGTGLGLYLSKSIVELHHGKIWVESKGENQGATFSFTLPYEQKTKQRTMTTETVSTQ